MKKVLGYDIYQTAKVLWPFNRSITGDGVRMTLAALKNIIPDIKVFEVQSGQKAYDWTVPQEWKIKDAYIIGPNGNKFCNFKKNNLHVVGYSVPINRTMNLENLQKHLYSIPQKKNAIPYVTSYYNKNWGFCISHSQRQKLKKGLYKVKIDSKIFNGSLTYGEIIIKGKINKEIFISTYVCHPSMANNEISGPVVTAYLAKFLKDLKKTYYTYRIIFVPETIGSIVYIKKNYKLLKKNVIGGFNISCVGDDRTYSFVPSRNGQTVSDQIANHVLKHLYPNYKKYSWLDRGSDERQYCSPGVDLPICSIHRSKYGTYPEYHTSEDNLKKVVTPKGLNGGYNANKLAIEIFENNFYYISTNLCEPQLSKYNLRSNVGGLKLASKDKIISDIISLCDGKNSLLDIAEKLHLPIWKLYEFIKILLEKRLIKKSNKKISQ